MRVLLFILGVIVLFPPVSPVLAQGNRSVPPPQVAPSSGAVKAPVARGLGVLFSELEKKIIRETLGAVVEGVTGQKLPDGKTAKSDDDDFNKRDRHSKNNNKRKKRGRGKKGQKGQRGMPPGLAKRDSLPPGLQKQLERNGKLPPGLQKRALPRDLQAKLPRRRRGLERVIVDRDVVLIDTVTNTVLDIIKNVVLK